jgi:hypothetical protein
MGIHLTGLGLVAGVVLAAGCASHGLCDASTCAGCCDVSGTCQLGTTPTACGSHGGTCEDCVGGSCFAGSCLGGATGGGHGGAGGGSTAGYPTCNVAEDCPYWFCECASGPPLNSRPCVNNVCLDGAQSCGDACAGFDSCWLGTSGGGFPQGSHNGPNTCSGTGGGSAGSSCAETDLGKGCTVGSDCQSGMCFGVSPSFLCTKSCTTANDCPENWACGPTTGGGSVCMTGISTTPKSTNSLCHAFFIGDVGNACSNCESGFCTSNECTKRCDVSVDCPSGWSCGSGGSFNMCIP